MKDLKYNLALDKSTPISWHLAIPLIIYILSLGLIGYQLERFYISNYIGIVVAIYYFTAWLFTQYPLPFPALYWVFYLLWMFLTGTFVAFYKGPVIGASRTFIQLLVLILMISSYVTSLRRLKLITWAMLITTLLPLATWLLGMADPTYQVMEGTERFIGTASQPNVLGAFLVVGISCGILAIYLSSISGKVLAILIIIPQIIGLIKTGSRSAFVMLLFIIVSTFFYHYIMDFKAHYKQAIIGIILLTFMFIYGWIKIQETLLAQRLLMTIREGQTSGRYLLAVEAFKYFIRNPLFGIGINNFRYVSGIGSYPHNNVLVVLTGTGIIGGILFYAPYLIYWRKINRLRKNATSQTINNISAHMLASILTIFAYGMFMDTWRQKFIACFMGLIFGSVNVMENLIQKRQYNEYYNNIEAESILANEDTLLTEPCY